MSPFFWNFLTLLFFFSGSIGWEKEIENWTILATWREYVNDYSLWLISKPTLVHSSTYKQLNIVWCFIQSSKNIVFYWRTLIISNQPTILLCTILIFDVQNSNGPIFWLKIVWERRNSDENCFLMRWHVSLQNVPTPHLIRKVCDENIVE